MKVTLPPLSETEQRHHEAVAQAVVQAIKQQGGFLPFAAFMQLVLYAPRLGYYAVGTHKLGRDGDFITAPELSPLFAQALATQAEPILSELGPAAQLLELGAGSGQLAFDMLLSLERLKALPSRYAILEISPDLRARQQQTLARLPAHLVKLVHWLERPPQQPWHGLLIANEVVDALAVSCVEFTQGQWHECGVVESPQGLKLALRPASETLRARIHAKRPKPIEGERRELCEYLTPWVQSVLAQLVRGVGLFIDYGGGAAEIFADERTHGTLSCFFKHHQHSDVLRHLGVQDITAWVDFTALTQAAASAQATLLGFTTQAAFVLANDFDQHYQYNLTYLDPLRLAQAARQLLLPTQMGERFKVLAVGKNYAQPLRGFSNDLRHLLG
jgi:SAM-dependent MidA family methyltransferase